VTRLALLLPLLLFVAIAFMLWRGFSLEDPHKLPSALIDRPLPRFSLPTLERPEVPVTREDVTGRPFLLNVWATWCPTCRAEHAELERIAREHAVPIYGVNYKDDPAEAVRWLARYGDPYVLSVIDADGSFGIDLGVYGAPETFVVDAGGVIRYKRVGAVDRRVWEEEIAPVLRELGMEFDDLPAEAG
jgi:cytochrome c biogenesis protein CcmG/thiol:disulfide interchange protein DsbE